jgi:hypothetical protein
VRLLALFLVACGSPGVAPRPIDASPPADARVDPDAAPLPAPKTLHGLDGLAEPAWPAKNSCGAYLDAARALWADVLAVRAAAADRSREAVAAAGRRLREAEARLRPLAPGTPPDLVVVHNALMSAIDRLAAGCELGARSMADGNDARMAQAEGQLGAGLADLDFAFTRLVEMCGK